ncbi:MAG: hypothetical protein KAR40_05455 [Candidatus Sabulitectum sp.]|nr:hypothetical protein [Candidatus Sabulitectum sp.]
MQPWIPPILRVRPWEADTYDMLYGVFCEDIRDSKLIYAGHDVWFFRQEFENGKEALFWHLTTQKPPKIPRRMQKFVNNGTYKEETERLPDLLRCERLCWINPIICNHHKKEILDWDYEEGNGTIKTYLWLKGHSFLVVLKYFPNGCRRLITSFYVNSSYKRKDLERKLSCRIQ